MKKTYKRLILNKDVSLSKRSVNDKISTLKTSELELLPEEVPQGAWFRVMLAGFVEVDAFANRKDGKSLTIHNQHLPRYARLPKVGSPTVILVRSIKRQY